MGINYINITIFKGTIMNIIMLKFNLYLMDTLRSTTLWMNTKNILKICIYVYWKVNCCESLFSKKILYLNLFIAIFYWGFKKLMPILQKFFQKIEKNISLFKLFSETSRMMIQKSERNITTMKNYKPTPFINITQKLSTGNYK